MRYGSVCSGIEAATSAWHSLGWVPSFFSEIEEFPRRVLEHHYPDVPLHGDFTTIGADDYGSIDVLVGGTPCQSFSVAGLRGGMDDERGNLALEYLKLAQRKRPRWLVWENVPGVLSSSGGRDFGAFLGGLVELGYGFAYRVLDAFYFGCAVPRPRVFVVAHSGAFWQGASAVLFERESFTYCAARGRKRARPHTFSTQNTGSRNARGNIIVEADGWRGMTPTETEKGLGFPDNYTNVPFVNGVTRLIDVDGTLPSIGLSQDVTRYKALGNSMAVPVMAWIGERIQMVESMTTPQDRDWET